MQVSIYSPDSLLANFLSSAKTGRPIIVYGPIGVIKPIGVRNWLVMLKACLPQQAARFLQRSPSWKTSLHVTVSTWLEFLAAPGG